MIDIENKVVDTLANALPDVYVTTSYEIKEKKLPALLVHYTYSGDYDRSFDNHLAPHHARISVQLDAYAKKRARCKEISTTAENTMHGMKFTCTEARDLSGYYNGLCRITSRFSAVVEEGREIDGNTVHQMYRK